MPAVCRVGDAHACGATAAAGSPNVFANGRPVHRVGDADTHGAVQAQGSSTVFVNGRPISRVGDDLASDALDHPPNPHVAGSPNVFAGG